MNGQFPYVKIINASAGSGKTYSLAQEFLSLTLHDNIDLAQRLPSILVLTFTRNATKEMKNRILLFLKKEALREDDKKVQERANSLLEMILRDYFCYFNVHTIDSFLMEILSSLALEYGVTPDLELLLESSQLIEVALEQWIEEINQNLEGYKEIIDQFLSLVNEFEGIKFLWDPLDKLKIIVNRLLQKEADSIEEVKFNPKYYFDFKEKFNQFFEELKTIYFLGKGELSLKSNQKWIEKLIEGGGGFSFDTIINKSISEKNFPFVKPKGGESILYKELKERWFSLSNLYKEVIYFYSLTKYYPYLVIYSQVKRHIKRVKLEMGIAFLGELTKSILASIRDKELTYPFVSIINRYRHILLDEFQDTSKIQWYIIQFIVEEALSKGGSFFAVGDLKQAIYMFRNADYKIMKGIIEAICKKEYGSIPFLRIVQENSLIEKLKFNQRSDGEIVNYCKEVFTVRLKEILSQEESDYEDRSLLTSFEQSCIKGRENRGYVKTYLFNFEEEELMDKEGVKNVILEIIKDVSQRFDYGDIAILAYHNREVETIINWLVEAQIPATSFSSLDIRKRKIIGEILAFLKFVDTPWDDLSFATFILGDIFERKLKKDESSYNRNSILKWMEGRGTQNLPYLYLKFRFDFKELWDRYFALLLKIAGSYPLYEFVTKFFSKFSLFEDFPEETGTLIQFLEIINRLAYQGVNTISEVIEKFESSYSEEELFSLLLPELKNSVNVMTFHKAKGLGFDVVINLISLSKIRPDFLPIEVLEDFKTKEPNFFYINKKVGQIVEELGEFYNEKRLDEKIQVMNLLYVALTRAKHELYNIVLMPEDERKLPLWLKLFKEEERGEKGIHRVKEKRYPKKIVDIEINQFEERDGYPFRFKEVGN